MRAFGRANALNRSADQCERTMMQRRFHQRANPRAGQPEPAIAPRDPIADDAAIEAAVAEAMHIYATCISAQPPAQDTGGPVPAAPAKTVPTPAPATPMPVPVAAQPPIAAGPPGAARPAAPDIRYRAAVPPTGNTQPPQHRQQLLRSTAIQRAVDPAMAAHPA
jgi:hypothetical protein